MNTEFSYLSALGPSDKRQVEHEHVYFPFLINNNYIFIIKMNFLIQKTLELYKQMEEMLQTDRLRVYLLSDLGRL